MQRQFLRFDIKFRIEITIVRRLHAAEAPCGREGAPAEGDGGFAPRKAA